MRAWVAAVLTLGLSLAATGVSWSQAERAEHRRREAAFAERVDEAERRLVRWMNSSEQLLWGVRAIFASTPWVERTEFRDYVNALELRRYSPGIQAVGFAKWLPHAALEAHERMVREVMPSYEVRPPGPRPFYGPILYVEPYDELNARALGFDMYSEPTRREAMRTACDEGRTVLSGPLRLVQEPESSHQAGVVLYVPIYRHRAPVGTPEERREHLLGWTFAAFRVGELMTGVLGGEQDLEVRLYDGPPGPGGRLLFETGDGGEGEPLEDTRRVTVIGREWTLVTRARPRFLARVGTRTPLIVALTGTTLSLAASALVFALFSALRARSTTSQLLAHRRRLEQSELHFRSMAEHAPLMVFTTGLDGGCTWVNRRWIEFTGRPLDAHLGDCWADSIHPDDRPRVVEAYQAAFRRREACQLECRARRHDGAWRWLMVVAVPQVDERGEFWGFQGSCVDVHEHHESEARLAESELRLRLALKGGDLATWEVDLDTGRLSVSERFAELLGLPECPRGWHLGELLERVHPDDRPALEQATVAQVSSSQAPFRVEVRARREGGGWVWVLISGMVVLRSPGGTPVRLAGTVMDVSERRRAEHERQQFMERFTRAERSASLGTLASGMAHEINNPLSVVLTNVAYARWQLERPVDAVAASELKAALDDAAQAVTRVKDLVAELGSLTALSGEGRASCELGHVLRRAERVASALAVPGAQVIIDDLGGLPPVHGGEGELVQLFGSLLTNAVQATRADRPNPVRVSAERTDGLLRVRIIDQGRGMPPEVLRQVYDPFFTTRAPGAGKGLGVTIAVAIARALGGTLEYERSTDEGTAVVVTLPVAGAGPP